MRGSKKNFWSGALALGLTAALSSGCGGRQVQESTLLPFHVAVVPTRVDSIRPVVTAEDIEAPGIELDLESHRISTALEEALDGRVFSQATLLAYPETREEFSKWSEADQERHWLAEARRQKADVLMTSLLGYDATVETSYNEKFWLNLPLFLLGGPFCYFVNDRSYFADAKLDVRFYSLSLDLESLEDSDAEMLGQIVRAEFTETTLDFVDRAGGDTGSYALSLVVPAGLLSKENESVRERVEEAALQGLGDDLSSEIRNETVKLNRNTTLSSFALDLDLVEVLRDGDDRVSFSVPIRLLFGAGISEYEIRAQGMSPVSERFRDAPEEGLFWIRKTLSMPRATQVVKLWVWDTQALGRTYTFRIETPEEEE